MRDVARLSGLRRAMPVTAAAGVLAALSMSGLPPFLGFLYKELLYEATLEGPVMGSALVVAAVLTNVLLVAAAGMAGIRPFIGAPGDTPKSPHEASPSLWLGPVLLAALGAGFGLMPGRLSRLVVAPAVEAVLGQPVEVKLALWHGLNLIVVLSAVTLAGGVALFFGRRLVLSATRPMRTLGRWGPDRGYALGLDALNAVAGAQTRFLQSGYLRFYVMLIIGTAVGLMTTAFLRGDAFRIDPGPLSVRVHELAVAVIVLLGAVAAARASSRLAAVAALGAVGYGTALLFILFGAPDLAITQFAIETLTVILFLLVVYRLPAFAKFSSTASRLRDAVVAGAAGLLVTLLVLTVTSVPGDSQVSRWFAENSYPLAHGRNIVNVILVDFRALDTLGEITVLAVAAVGVFALMKLRPGAAEEE
jgi:multicomponent Na+:H+ antiporter subunit A